MCPAGNTASATQGRTKGATKVHSISGQRQQTSLRHRAEWVSDLFECMLCLPGPHEHLRLVRVSHLFTRGARPEKHGFIHIMQSQPAFQKDIPSGHAEPLISNKLSVMHVPELPYLTARSQDHQGKQASMSEAQLQYATYHDLAEKRVLVTGKVSCMTVSSLPLLSGINKPAPALHLWIHCTIQSFNTWPCMPFYLGMPDMSQSSPEAAPTCAGATGGIGKAIALAFATQGQLDICLWSRSRDKLEAVARQVEQLGSRPHIVTGDLTKGEDCRRGVAEAVSLAMSCQLCWPAACQQGAGLGHVIFQRACSCRQSCSLGVSGCE